MAAALMAMIEYDGRAGEQASHHLGRLSLV
jgi:hypothetical protein